MWEKTVGPGEKAMANWEKNVSRPILKEIDYEKL
jgi:hypothetical protein